MSRFFAVFAIVCTVLYLGSLSLGYFPQAWGLGPSGHMLVGLSTALLVVSLHCLIFGIFTGAGKDTRELVQELKLNTEPVKRMKRFKREVFPPALYAIFFILITTSLGGALSVVGGGIVLRVCHQLAAWFTFYYNVKTFVLEYKAVKENSQILSMVNSEASIHTPSVSARGTALPILEETTEHLEWGSHVYAFGKFLVFMGYNTWLPFLYLRYVVGMNLPVWPFIMAALLFWLSGYFLRWKYQSFRPKPHSTGLPA